MSIAVSSLAIYFIASEIKIDVLHDALDNAKFAYIVPCVILLLAGLVARAFRWHLLLSGDLPLYRAFHIMNIAYLVNGILPLRIGEVARAYLSFRSEPSVPVLKTASTIVVERLLDLLAVVLMVAVALAVGPVPDELRVTGAFLGIVGFSGFMFLVFLSRKRQLSKRILAFLMERIAILRRFKLEQLADNFLDGLLPLTQVHTLLLALGWTALSWGLSVCAGYVLMYTFFDHPGWAVTCSYIAAAAFAIAVPAVPGNLGPYEASILVALTAFGYGEPETVAVAFAVLVHGVNVIVHAFTGIVGFIAEGVTFSQLSKGVKEVTKADVSEINYA